MNDRPNPGWWDRNWKWFVPTGCLTLILIAGLLLFGLIGLGIKGVSSLMGSSEPVRHAVTLAEANPAAVAALGTPMEPGMMMSGTLQTNNDSGHADLTIPLKGPKGNGRVYIKGDREADRWTYSLIELSIDASGDRIDLLDGDRSAAREVPPDIDHPPVQQDLPDPGSAHPDATTPDTTEPDKAEPDKTEPSESVPERTASAG